MLNATYIIISSPSEQIFKEEIIMNEQSSIIRTQAPPPGTLKKSDLYAISLGYVIGAGIISLVGPAIALTGYSAWVAFFIAILFGFLVNLPAVFVTSTLRMAGGP